MCRDMVGVYLGVSQPKAGDADAHGMCIGCGACLRGGMDLQDRVEIR